MIGIAAVASAAPPSLARSVGPGWAQELERTVDQVVAPLADWATRIIFYPIPIGGAQFPAVVAWMILAGVVCTIVLGAVQFRGLRVAYHIVRGRFARKDDPGEVPQFQALTSALSGTVGLGNIAGVGAAIAIGGAGATFWMIVAGLLGMCTKFVECTLGVKYRKINPDGSVAGGPFAYLPVAFQRFGKLPTVVLTGVYAVSILAFGMAGGNMFQSNQTYAQLSSVAGGPVATAGGALVFGLVLATLVALVIVGGIRSVGRVTSILVPVMGVVYVAACAVVIAVNVAAVPDAFRAIVQGAFAPAGIAGGIAGVIIVGFQRAAFSSEAGLGSAAIAHSAAKTRRPVSEGFVALFEPFIDTVVICTMTALTIVIAGAPSLAAGQAQVRAGEGTPNGVVLTSDAFATVLPWFPYVLALAVALFAFSTLVTWSYYCQRAWEHLFGRGRVTILVFRAVYCCFTALGALLTFSEVLNLTDAALFLCAFINLLGLYLLLPGVRADMKEYLADWRSGRLAAEADEARETVTV